MNDESLAEMINIAFEQYSYVYAAREVQMM